MRSFYEAFPYSSPRLAWAPSFSDYVETIALEADALLRVAIPSGARFVLFSFEAPFWAKLGTVATSFSLPNLSTGDGSGGELNPAARRIPETLDGIATPTHLCLRASVACKGSLAFYA